MDPENDTQQVADRGDDLAFLDDGKKGEDTPAPEGKGDAAPEGEQQEQQDQRKPQVIHIPKQRLDQEIAKRRAAEARAQERIEALESQIVQQRENADVRRLEQRLSQLDEAHDKALADGETKDAKQIKAEIRHIERLINRAESAQQSIAAKQQAVAEVRYDMVLSRIEFEYPQINPDNPDYFDPAAAEECFELIEAFKTKGLSPDQALARAVRYVLGPPQSALRAAEQDVEREGLRRAVDPAEERRMNARKKLIDAAGRQPGTNRTGVDSDKLGSEGKISADAISRMTQKQFAKIDEDTLKKLRGDEL